MIIFISRWYCSALRLCAQYDSASITMKDSLWAELMLMNWFPFFFSTKTIKAIINNDYKPQLIVKFSYKIIQSNNRTEIPINYNVLYYL